MLDCQGDRNDRLGSFGLRTRSTSDKPLPFSLHKSCVRCPLSNSPQNYRHTACEIAGVPWSVVAVGILRWQSIIRVGLASQRKHRSHVLRRSPRRAQLYDTIARPVGERQLASSGTYLDLLAHPPLRSADTHRPARRARPKPRTEADTRRGAAVGQL